MIELLTQEYELARVQEAKEIPTVKELDPPEVPEKKTLPPRMLIGATPMFSAFLVGILFLVGSRGWNDKDPQDLSKAIVTEILFDLKEKRFLNPVNGVSHGPETATSSLCRRRSIFSLLGLSNVAHNGNGSYVASNHVPEEKRSEKEVA